MGVAKVLVHVTVHSPKLERVNDFVLRLNQSDRLTASALPATDSDVSAQVGRVRTICCLV
eukprot:6195384-Pleurochrysis_carterae.AAC.3